MGRCARRYRWPAWIALGLAVGALGAGCDWRDFDKLQDRVPVVVASAPDGFGSSDFGRFMLPVSPPPDTSSVAGRYLVSGAAMTGLAQVELDGGGHASVININSTALTDLGGVPIVSMAEVPGAAGPLVLMGAVRSGTLGGGQVLVLSLAPMLEFTVLALAEQTTPDFGLGVTAQSFPGVGAPAPDYVVLTDDTVHVYADGVAGAATSSFISSPACPIGLPVALAAPYRQSRAVVTGNWGGGGMQVAVGTPTGGGQGSVSFFSVNSAGISCAFSMTGVEPRFGQSLAVGDFNGDGMQDLLIGAPPSNAYVVLGGALSSVSPKIALPSPAGPVEFGAAVAAVNVDGAGGDEAVVGDPDATVDMVAQAGRVVIYSVPVGAGTPTVKAQLTDRYPSMAARYGGSVGALQFCKTPCTATDRRRLTLIGADSETFTAFKLADTDPDPRVAAP